MIRRALGSIARFSRTGTFQLRRPLLYGSYHQYRYFCTDKKDPMQDIKEEAKQFYEKFVDNVIELERT